MLLTLEEVKDLLPYENISVSQYREEKKLCGYELDTYTPRGVNMIVFLDFREKGNPESAVDFLSEFEQYLKDFDIDEEIDTHRQDKRYKNDFTISESLEDFKAWKKNLKRVIKKINKH